MNFRLTFNIIFTCTSYKHTHVFPMNKCYRLSPVKAWLASLIGAPSLSGLFALRASHCPGEEITITQHSRIAYWHTSLNNVIPSGTRSWHHSRRSARVTLTSFLIPWSGEIGKSLTWDTMRLNLRCVYWKFQYFVIGFDKWLKLWLLTEDF